MQPQPPPGDRRLKPNEAEPPATRAPEPNIIESPDAGAGERPALSPEAEARERAHPEQPLYGGQWGANEFYPAEDHGELPPRVDQPPAG